METVLGSSLGVFLGLTVVVAGFAAWMSGQVVAATWKPAWHAVLYAVLLGAADRFLVFALFDGPLLSARGYLAHTAVLVAIALVATRYNRVRLMERQYPWEWRRTGPFSLRRLPAERDD